MKRLAALLAASWAPVFGQCVMCFRTAAAQNAARSRLMDVGIVLLGVPPFAILAGFCWLAWKRNKVTVHTQDKMEPQMDTDTHRSLNVPEIS